MYHPELSAFWNDARDFILNCSTVLQWNTPHIYLSILPFTPWQSRVRQTYLPRFPNTVQIAIDEVDPSSDHENDHPLVLSHLSVSPNGKIVVSCFGETFLHARSIDLHALSEHQAICHSVGIVKAKFNLDGTSIYLLTSRGVLLNWELGQTHANDLYSHSVIDFDVLSSSRAEYVISPCEDGSIRVWSRELDGYHRTLTEPLEMRIGETSLGQV